LYQTSGGSTGIPGSKRDTPASAETAAKLFFNQILQRGYSRCYLRIDGLFDNTTRAAVRGLQSSGLINFSKVQHAKVVAHNGVRLPKARRT
jgi:ribosomal protein S11